jgi:PHD/YefM family antitoxin component YafN of YafNO toxin-antitoxin module
MPTIKPFSELRTNADAIAELCHTSDEPIFLTKDGEGDLVVMSLATYEREQRRIEVYRLLDEAEADVRAGDQGIGMKALRKRLGR